MCDTRSQNVDGGERRLANGTAILIDSRASADRLALIEVVVRHGEELPRHRHHWEDETLYVLSGEVGVWSEAVWRILRPGESAFLPRGGEHAVAALGEEARLLVAVTPAGFEGFYRALGRAGNVPLPLDRLVALAARHGCEITGPCPAPPAGLSAHPGR
ncbi:MAG TPA: cupin domain-containing protein [Thermomicrobiaceae bacterium]|nr:cupin domain-containing protein [Thermomicrobiaceae bacterium]